MALLLLTSKLCRSALQTVLSCKTKGAEGVESHTTDLTSASAIDQLVSTLLQRHKVRRKLSTGCCVNCRKQYLPAAPQGA